MRKTEAISIEDFMSENWEQFAAFESAAEEGLTKITRDLPPKLHAEIRSEVFKALISSCPLIDEKHRSRLKVRLVIDANIIVQDSFRVAKGKFSSTERIFSSPYLEVLAPDIIEKEVERKIHEKLPKGASLEKALAHAQKLFTLLRKNSSISSATIESASTLIKQHSPEDIPYLALAIEYEADAIVSRDKKAFDRQPEVKRWELGEAVVISVTYESGALSLFVLGATAEVLAKAFEHLLIALLHVLESALEIIVTLFTAIVEKSVEMLSKIPGWAWAIIIVLVIVLIFHEGFRDWVGGVASDAAAILAAFARSVIEIGKILWNAFKSVLIWLWNLMLPVIVAMVILAGVLCRRVWRLLTVEMTRTTGKDISGKDSSGIGV